MKTETRETVNGHNAVENMSAAELVLAIEKQGMVFERSASGLWALIGPTGKMTDAFKDAMSRLAPEVQDYLEQRWGFHLKANQHSAPVTYH